jgi:Domain of unknown function (DUF6487)
MNIPICPKCTISMEEGFLVDHGYGFESQTEWVEGMPQKSSWIGLKIGDKVRRPVFTFCCPGCGFLESYAQIKPEEGRGSEGG